MVVMPRKTSEHLLQGSARSQSGHGSKVKSRVSSQTHSGWGLCLLFGESLTKTANVSPFAVFSRAVSCTYLQFQA